MKLKKAGKALLFPHIAVMLMLLPVSAVFLIWSMIYTGVDSVTAIVSYVLAAYTLTVWCLRMPSLIRAGKDFKNQNKYAKRWTEDARLRVSITLYGTLLWNTAYAVFQLALGFYHASFWYFSLAGYYISLAVMRFYLVRYTHRYEAGELMREELKRYRACGIVFLVMNLMISVMVFFMIYWGRTFRHHEITTITIAAYTFLSLFLAVRGYVRYRKYNSPVYSASRAISLAAACVSLMTMESTMLTTFGGDSTLEFRRTMLALSGGVTSAIIIAMAVYMIVNGTKKIKQLKTTEEIKHE